MVASKWMGTMDQATWERMGMPEGAEYCQAFTRGSSNVECATSRADCNHRDASMKSGRG